MGLPEELATRIEHANSCAGGGLSDGNDVGSEDPWVPGAKAVGAFPGNSHFRLRGGWFQSNMVADSFSNTTM